jgi:hypothetical protein
MFFILSKQGLSAWKGLVKAPCFHKMKIVQTLFQKRMDFTNYLFEDQGTSEGYE